MSVKKIYSEDNQCDMYEADYRVRLSSGKLRRIRKMYFTKEAAVKAIRRDKVAAERGEFSTVSKITLKEWRERVMRYVKAHRKQGTYKQFNFILTLFNRVIGEGRKIESLDRADLRRFVEYLKTDQKNDSSIRAYYAKVRAGLNLAPQLFQELVSWHPPTIRFESFTKPRSRVLEPAEIAELLKHLNSDMQDIVLCALNTGGRLQEILTLTWDCVLWDAPGFRSGALRLRVTKIRGIKETWRTIPATDEVLAILSRRRQSANGSRYVFPSPQKSNMPRSALTRALRSACKDAGILYGRDKAGGFVFHDLRRTAVTYLRRSGADIETVCSITGHSPSVMLSVYSIANVDAQQRALDLLAKSLPFGQLRESGKSANGQNAQASLFDSEDKD